MNIKGKEEKDANYYYKKGVDKSKTKDFKGAIEDFNKAIEINQHKLPYYDVRARAKFDFEDYTGAIEDFSWVIEVFGMEDAEAYYFRGLAKSRLKDYQGAIEDFDKAIKIDPDYKWPYIYRGKAKSDLKDYQGAIKDYNKGIEFDQNNPELYKERAFAKSELKDYSGAIEDYNKAIELDSDWWGYYSDRGYAKRNLKDYQGAIEDFNKAIELDQNNPELYQERGKVKGELKDYQGAIDDLNKALEIKPNGESIIKQISEIKKKLKDNAKSPQKQKKIIHSHEEFVPGGFGTTSKNQSVKSKKQISVVGSDEILSKEKMYKQMVNLYNDTDIGKSIPKALVLIEKLLKIDPTDGMLYYYKGGSYLFLGEYKKAIEAFYKAKDMLQQPPEDLQENMDHCYSMVENSNSHDTNSLSTKKPSTQKNKKLLAGLMGIFFGGFGVHKFVLGYKKPGLIMLIGSLVTFGLLFYVFAIIGFIEGIIYLTKSDDDFYATYQEGKKNWF